MGWLLAFWPPRAWDIVHTIGGLWLFVMGFVALLCAAYDASAEFPRMRLGDCDCDRSDE
jgi:hypothetical protein